MIKTEERVIEGVRYQVTQFPAMEAQRLLTRLPGLEAILTGGREGSDANEEELEKLTLRLLSQTRIMEQNGGAFDGPGGRALFNMHFAGKLATMRKVIDFVLEVNYQDFFDGLDQEAIGGVLRGAAARRTTPSSAGSGPEPIKN